MGRADRIALLRRFKDQGKTIKIQPMCPKVEYDRFRVLDVEGSSVHFKKESNQDQISVPLRRVEDVLDDGGTDLPTVLLNGRLQ
jgi:hypothetical protein